MKLIIGKLSDGEWEEKTIIINIKKITHYKHYNEDGSTGTTFMYWLKKTKYTTFGADEYKLPKGYNYFIEEE